MNIILTRPVDLQQNVSAFPTFSICALRFCLQSIYFELLLCSLSILPCLFSCSCFLLSFFVSVSVSRVRVNSFSILFREIECENKKNHTEYIDIFYCAFCVNCFLIFCKSAFDLIHFRKRRYTNFCHYYYYELAELASSRTRILKSLALASKVKSLALKPQVLKNCPVVGSRTVLFLNS